MSKPTVNLWRHADFLKLWFGQTISGFGSRFTGLALPFTAITLLAATPAQLGVLVAASGLPWLLVGPFIGVWIDRLRRLPILIVTDVGRAICLALIPILAAVGLLQIEVLYVIAFLNGLLTAWFETAYQSYVPSLIGRDQLLDGNSKLNVSSSAADVVGPSIAGAVIQAFGVLVAVVVDAISFIVSALSLWLIRTPEPAPQSTNRPSFWASFKQGVRYIGRNQILRAFAATNVTFMIGIGMAEAVMLLFLTSTLKLDPQTIGLMYGVASIGGLAGAVIAGKIAARFGVGRTIISASLLRGIGYVGIPLAAFSAPPMTTIIVILSYALHQFGWSVWAVTQASVRQAATPNQLQGRVTASFLFLVRSATPIGALVGGGIGEWLGILPTLGIAALGLLSSTIWLLFSPLWRLREPASLSNEPGVLGQQS